MILYNRVVLVIIMAIFSVLLVALQIALFWKSYVGKTLTNTERDLWICDLLSVLALTGIVIANMIIYWNYIPANSPGCLPHISEFGVIANSVDPTKFIAQPPTVIPAASYSAAVTAFKSSSNGLATGYFAWDGLNVTILTSQAYQLASGASPGNSWVFQSLNTMSP